MSDRLDKSAASHDLIETIRRAARVGGSSCILPGIEIGEEAFVAAGAVVTRDVPPRTLVMGVPAKAIRDVPEEELLPPADA